MYLRAGIHINTLWLVIPQFAWDVQGETFEHWLSSKSQLKVKMMNTLVDLLEDVPINVTEKQPQHWLSKDLSRKRDKLP
jgi:hypothetical protein